MIDSWSNESLMIPNKVREVFTLTASKGVYTIGPAGDFITARPMQIENALLQVTTTTPTLELPIKILNKYQYAGIILKATQSTYPLYLYAEGTYPAETIDLWPVPSKVSNIALYSWKQLQTFADLSTVVVLPPGYHRAIRYNLAIELAPEYGKTISAEVAKIAADSLAAIKRKNEVPHYLMVDDALRAKPAVWNWMTGEPT
jgi:hypothetical protein